MEGGSRTACSWLLNDEAHLWRVCVFVDHQHGNEKNAIENMDIHTQAIQVVLDSFYVDDGMIGANLIEEAVWLHKELQELFAVGGFMLHKW